MRSWSWTTPSSKGESLSKCMGCELPVEEMLWTLWILLNQLEKVHGMGCGYPWGHHLGCVQASLTACPRAGHQCPGDNPHPPWGPMSRGCRTPGSMPAALNHAMEAEVHRYSGKALHYVESEVESSLQGKVGSLGYASNAVPNFHAFGLEDSFYLCDKFSKLHIILKLVREENIIGVFPSLVSLHSKLPPDPFTSTNIRVEHVLYAICLCAMHLALMVSWAEAWAAICCVASMVERCQNFWRTSAWSSWHSVTNW